MGWISNPKHFWNWNGRGQVTFVVTMAFLQLAGGFVVWLALYDGQGNKVPIGAWEAVVGLIGMSLLVAGFLGSLGVMGVGLIHRFQLILGSLWPRFRTELKAEMIPFIASVASFVFGAYVLDAVVNRPVYFRDELLGLMATLLVAFAASYRSIEAYTEPSSSDEEE